MNFPYFIARHIHARQEKGRREVSPAVSLAIVGVAMGLAVMILAVAIVIGFKHQVRDKLTALNHEIQISAFDSNTSYETRPIALDSALSVKLRNREDITGVFPYVTKPGILKTKDQFMGFVLKGVSRDDSMAYLKSCLIEGELPSFNDTVADNKVLVSQKIALALNLNVGDWLPAYFVQENVRARRFKITGIYRTDFSEFDHLFVIGDARQVQQLNGWGSNQYSGIGLSLENPSKLAQTTEEIYGVLIAERDSYGETYYVRSVEELNPQIFGWLELLDMNVWVILFLMALVAGFTMISGLLIIILERTQMIGLLKTMGSTNRSIRTTFLYVSVFLIGKGLLLGNAIGIGLALIQQKTGFLTLNPEVYYIDKVPISLNIWYILAINLFTLMITVGMLIGPSYVISLIRPAQTVKFE